MRRWSSMTGDSSYFHGREMGFENGAMVESSNISWSARGLALSVDILWFGNGETRIVAGFLALSVVEADEIGMVQWCSERGVLGVSGVFWNIFFWFFAWSPMVAGLRASTGCEFLFRQTQCFLNDHGRFILRYPFCAYVSAPRLLVGYKNTSLVIPSVKPSVIWICLSYTLTRIKPTNHGGRQVRNCSHMDENWQH